MYKLAGPKTFRRSSVKILHQWGGNIQNIEKGMRAIYESDGHNESQNERLKFWLDTGDITVFTEEELSSIRCLLQVDQAGAEALVVAYECTNADYRQLFINGVSPHVYVALKFFPDVWKTKAGQHNLLLNTDTIDALCLTKICNLKLNPDWKQLAALIKSSDDWGLTERYYYLSKQTGHSANYDIQWSTFIMNILEKSGGKIVIKREQGEYFLNMYRALFPEIPERCQRIRKQVEDTKMLFNLHGHPYIITDYNVLNTTMKDLYAWPAQSTVGEITRIAFSKLQEYIESENRKWDILEDNHDSYLVQCPLSEIKECKTKMQEFMNQKLISPVDGVEFNMKSECQVGFNWAPFKKEINSLGLRELSWI